MIKQLMEENAALKKQLQQKMHKSDQKTQQLHDKVEETSTLRRKIDDIQAFLMEIKPALKMATQSNNFQLMTTPIWPSPKKYTLKKPPYNAPPNSTTDHPTQDMENNTNDTTADKHQPTEPEDMKLDRIPSPPSFYNKLVQNYPHALDNGQSGTTQQQSE